ncbi:MAG: sensor histidine kinase [Saprospiraceae bacterium]
MIINFNTQQWRTFAIIAAASLIVPMLIIFYILISTQSDSVILLEGYPTVVILLIIAYYILISAIGSVWLIQRLLAIFKLKNALAASELKHLQSQVNPHFFFNTLNNLYGLIGKDTQRAQQLVLQLSELMRYSIYEGQKEVVTIAEEVAYLKSYIALHEARYRKPINILFETKIADDQQAIMPLLFIILVENAFKHGVEQLTTDAQVNIELIATKEVVNFTISNNFSDEISNGKAGIGLKNLRRRLQLVYPKKHTFVTKQKGIIFTAQLSITN